MVHKANWKEMGLKELGFTIKDYKKLNKKNREYIDDYLKEMGH